LTWFNSFANKWKEAHAENEKNKIAAQKKAEKEVKKKEI